MGVFKEVTPLPSTVTLGQIIKSIPKEAYEKDESKALRSLVVTLVANALGMYLLYISPFWLLPVVWAYCGTAATGLFVIGHDCGHRSFMKSIFWNDAIGTLTMAPLLYPFHAWRIQHNVHHGNTNKLHVDTAWQPVKGHDYVSNNIFYKAVQRGSRGPMWFFGSIGHWIIEHFNLSIFKDDDLEKVKSSTTIITYFSLIFFPFMFALGGMWGIVKFWFIPWLGFHFWMSTFTLFHHTAPHIPFLDESKWHDATAALQHTIHVRYPAWIDFLTHDISVHVPHHVSTAIPHYNLRMAHASLKKNWAPYVQEVDFTPQLIWHVISQCHIHDDETRLYKTFADFLKTVGVINPPTNSAPKKMM
jgi:omega-6 fatty acid desaturase (delta-12 desaturase)